MRGADTKIRPYIPSLTQILYQRADLYPKSFMDVIPAKAGIQKKY